jgi:PhnB protein
MPISPYLHFAGTCREAMERYQSILGGKLDVMTYADNPEGPPEFRDPTRVMHSALMSPHGDIQASDSPPGHPGEPQASVSVHIELPTTDDGARVYAALSEGGDIVVPFGPSFFSPGFGILKDRFGAHWIVSVTPGG